MRKQVWDYLSRSWDNAEKDRARSEAAALELFEACSRDEWAIVQRLIEDGCNPNIRLGRRTALMQCCESGSRDCAKLLLALGADYSAQDEIGRDALFCCMDSFSDACVDLILSKRPKIKRLYDDNSTALIAATKLSYVHGVRQLVKYAPQAVNLYDRTGRTALWHVLSKPNPTDDDNEIARILLDAGADPDMPDLDGVAPRQAAGSENALAQVERHDIGVGMDHDAEPEAPQPEAPKQKRGMRL